MGRGSFGEIGAREAEEAGSRVRYPIPSQGLEPGVGVGIAPLGRSGTGCAKPRVMHL